MPEHKLGSKAQAFQYLLIGGLCATFDLMVFYTLLSIKVDLVVSTVIGYLSGTVASYLLNRKLTFRVLDQPIRRLILFFATAALGSALSAILILLGTQTTNFSALLIKVATLPVVAVFQFVLNKTWTFRIGN